MHERYPNSFLLRVSGDSMNRRIPDGSYALVDPCAQVDVSGVPYAVAVGPDAATVKVVRRLANGLELLPDSTDPTFRPMLYDYNEPGTPEVSVIGRIVWHIPPAPATSRSDA